MGSLKNVAALILDDNANMRHILRDVLTAWDVRHIVEAGDASQAVLLAAKRPPDIAFVDYKLECASGLMFCRAIRAGKDPVLRYLPIVTVSVYSEREKVVEAINAGVDEFLVKPVSPKDVASRVNGVIEKRRDLLETVDYFGPCRRRRVDAHYNGPLRRIGDEGDVEI